MTRKARPPMLAGILNDVAIRVVIDSVEAVHAAGQVSPGATATRTESYSTWPDTTGASAKSMMVQAEHFEFRHLIFPFS